MGRRYPHRNGRSICIQHCGIKLQSGGVDHPSLDVTFALHCVGDVQHHPEEAAVEMGRSMDPRRLGGRIRAVLLDTSTLKRLVEFRTM